MLKKIISISLSILIIASPVMAQNQNDRVSYVLPSAEGGLTSHISPYLAKENCAVEATNVRVNNQFGSLSNRDILVSEIDMGTGSVNGIHRYYLSNGNKYTIGAISTTLKYDASGTATTIAQGLTDGKHFQFITYKDILIAGNGYELPLKWDGLTTTTANTDNARTASDLCAELGAPFAQLSGENGGNDLDAEKYYQYKVAYYDGTTYSYSTARSNCILTGTAASNTQNLTCTNVPIGPTGTTHRYVYRTLGNSSRTNCIADTTYYMVKDLANNTTQTFDDAMADDDADADSAPTWATVSAGNNVTPPKGALLEINTERIFVSGNTTAGYQSDVYWSDDGNPDYFSPSSIIEVRPDDGDKVTFLKTFLGILTIGKTNTIQKFYTEGNPSVDWTLSNPFSFVGCPAPYTASVTPLGIFYLGRHGLYRFSGQASELISDSVTKEIEDISQVNIADCVGCYWNSEYHLAYASSASSSATNNRVLVYDIIRNAYVIDTKNINSFGAFGSGTDYGTLFSGTSTTDGYVFANSPTTYTFLKRYKSELDAGTLSITSTSGTEENPILSISTIDDMESYTNNTLARASWVVSEKTALKMVPPDLGTGVDKSKTVSADETLSAGLYNYTDLTVDAGKTLTASGNTIKCLGTVTVNGTLLVDTLYAQTVTVGAAGAIYTTSGTCVVKANTINNAGTLGGTDNRAKSFSSGQSGAIYSSNLNEFSASVTSAPPHSASGSFNGYVTYTFPSCHVDSVTYGAWDCTGSDGSGSRYAQVIVGGTTIASFSGSGIPGSSGGGGTISTGWDNVTYITLNCGGWSSYGNDTGGIGQTTFVRTYPVSVYYLNSTGTVGTSGSTSDFVNALEVFSDNTIVNEGTYSLKTVVPAGADTLNETITKTIADTDLSALTYIAVDVYSGKASPSGSITAFADGTGKVVVTSAGHGLADGDIVVISGTTNYNGSWTVADKTDDTYTILDTWVANDATGTWKKCYMQLGLGEGSLTDLVGIPVTTANTWETVAVNISGITDANIDHCTRAGIKFNNTTTGDVVYLDNIKPATTSGTWTSPIYDINAEALKKLYWNENLNTYGDVTWAVRTNSLNLMNGVTSAAATADGGASIVYQTSVAHGLAVNDLVTIAGYAGGNAGYNGNFTVTAVSDTTHFKVTCAFVGDAAGTWALRWTGTEYTNPNGSDISAENAERYIQFRATLSTTDTTNYLYPWLYQTDGFVFKINYSKLGGNYETSVSNVWKTGWRNLGRAGNKKMIKRVQVYYEGENENLTVNIKGDDNEVDQSFLIDMSVLPDTDITDRYTGTSTHKIYTWEPPVNTATEQSLISELFQFTVTHEGDEPFRVNQMKVYVNDENIY
jgi:hypothetical protein